MKHLTKNKLNVKRMLIRNECEIISENKKNICSADVINVYIQNNLETGSSPGIGIGARLVVSNPYKEHDLLVRHNISESKCI